MTPAPPLPQSLGETQHRALDRLEAWAEVVRRQRRQETHDGRLIAVEEAGGGRSEYRCNAAGDLVEIREADGSGSHFEYDELRRLSRVRESSGAIADYRYGAGDRLSEIDRDGVVSRFTHDQRGRLSGASCGNAGTTVYRYGERDRVIEARTAEITTRWRYGAAGRAEEITQERAGVAIALKFAYDARGRLEAVWYPGSDQPVRLRWDSRGRPQSVELRKGFNVRWEFDDASRTTRTRFSNGVIETSLADAVDRRTISRRVSRAEETLYERRYDQCREGRLTDDGVRQYEYDELGRVMSVIEGECVRTYAWDAMDRRIPAAHEQAPLFDGADRIRRVDERYFRYDDANRLIEVRDRGETTARFEYDHKGRLAVSHTARGIERFLYGQADELFAITDDGGRPLRLFVRTPLGCVAEVRGSLADGAVLFLHHDAQGSCHTVTDAAGNVAARLDCDPFGAPSHAAPQACFMGRFWHPEARLYCFGARWYDPVPGIFLTPDTFTSRPDDVRLVNALGDASGQSAARALMLEDWLRQPRRRNRHAFCGNDPINCVDPNGHWSFGGVLLMVLGAIWTLPNTIFGLLIEVTCLVGEVIRWLVWLVTAGNVSWATPGFDVAASGRLNAFALVFRGGWLGSFSSLLGITFGNVFFVYDDWENSSELTGGGDVSPTAYNGTETFPRRDALYEHELRHTNQYAWFGPFFHLGLPLWGFYEWDVIVNGYQNAWTERDARAHGGI